MKIILKHLLLVLVTASLTLISPAHAARKKSMNSTDFTQSHRYASLIVNSETGDVIYHKNAHNILHPASLTKLMTIYLAFQAIDDKTLSMKEKLPVSIRAASMPRTNLRLKPGQYITTRDAILGLIIHSANDAAVVLAEAISGSEEAFAVKMTKTARALGMKNSSFFNASGLPNENQVTTAYDLAKLAIALRRDYASYYPLFSIKSFKFNGRIINTHNRVMHRYPWADGLKTGFINASGFNLITSTNRHDGRLVGVVLGGSSAFARDSHMIQLLEYSYNKLSFNNQTVAFNDQQSRKHIDSKQDIFEVAQIDDLAISHTQSQSDVFSDLINDNNEITFDDSHAETNKSIKELSIKNYKEPSTKYNNNKIIVKKQYAKLKTISKKKQLQKSRKKVVIVKKKQQSTHAAVK